MKIQFSYQTKPLALVKHCKLLLRRLTRNEAMMRRVKLVIFSWNYNHLRISSHRLKIIEITENGPPMKILHGKDLMANQECPHEV